jgi:branched-chain amino acid transport system ATP-binding protein
MLKLENMHAVYGPIEALHGVSLTVPQGSIVGILGANGSGKTTLFKAIAGLVRVSEGKVSFNGKVLTNQPTEKIVAQGVSLIPQGRLLFPEMTVLENLEMGAYLLHDNAEFTKRLKSVQTMFPILKERSHQMVALMSGGEQQMLAIGRALMGQPELILLDEPSIGLAPKIFDQILHTVKEINALRKTTIVIAEQNVRKILKVVDYAYVLEAGKVALSGTAQELAGNESIRRAYLGL